MKRITLLVTLIIFSIGSIYADSAKNIVKSNVESKDYFTAAKYLNQALKENPKDDDLFMLCGDVYFEVENYDSSLICYKKARELKGDKTYILRKIGKALSYLERHREAIEILREAVQEEKKEIANYLELGQALIRADSLAEATLVITRAKDMDKNNPEAYVALGDLYFKQQVYELARKNYEDAISRDENLLSARINYARVLNIQAYVVDDLELRQDYIKMALTEWDKISKKDPKYVRAYLEKAKILYFSKEYQRAIKELLSYSNLTKLDMFSMWYLADSYYQLNACDSAIANMNVFSTELSSLKASKPNAVDSIKKRYRFDLDSLDQLANFHRANCYYRTKEYGKSVAEFDKLAAMNIPISSGDMQIYASSCILNGDTAKSYQVYHKLFDNDKSDCSLMYKVGQLARIAKNIDESNYFFNLYLQHCNDSLKSKVLFYLGYNAFNSGKAAEALPYIQQSEQLNPTDLLTIIYLADVYSSLDSVDLSKQKFIDAITLGVKDSSATGKQITNQAFQKYCGMLAKTKDYKALQKASKDWIDYSPDLSNAYLFHAISFHGQGDKNNACTYYRKALQLDPTNEKIKEQIKGLECNK
jgi:tetratricopeptide (TPR) repeat protein